MLKYFAFFALLAVAAAKPGLLAETHSVLQPAVIAKTAYVDTSASSAITHQSHVNLVRKVPVVYAAPVVKTISTPIIHTEGVYQAAPVYHSSAVVKTVSGPVVKTISAAPVVHSAPLVYAARADHVIHAAPVVHSSAVVHSAPLVHSAPVIHSVHGAPVLSALHSAPLVKTVVSSPLSYSIHH